MICPKYKNKRIDFFDMLAMYKNVRKSSGRYPWVLGSMQLAIDRPDLIPAGQTASSVFHRTFDETPLMYKPLGSKMTKEQAITNLADKFITNDSIDVIIDNHKIAGYKVLKAVKEDVTEEDEETTAIFPNYNKTSLSKSLGDFLELSPFTDSREKDPTDSSENNTPEIDTLPFEPDKKCKVVPIDPDNMYYNYYD